MDTMSKLLITVFSEIFTFLSFSTKSTELHIKDFREKKQRFEGCAQSFSNVRGGGVHTSYNWP